MSGEMVEHGGDELARAGESPILDIARSMMERIEDPSLAVDALERLLAAHHQHEEREERKRYMAAVERFQGMVPPVRRTRRASFDGGHNTAYSYASLDDVMEVVRGPLKECGLSVSFDCEQTEKGLVVVCYVQHGAHREAHRVPVPMPGAMKVNDTQKMGVAISYGKRYALCAALNIVVTDEDNDAASLTETITVEQEARLAELLQWSGISKERFLRHNGYENLSVIPADRFAALESALIQRGKAAGK